MCALSVHNEHLIGIVFFTRDPLNSEVITVKERTHTRTDFKVSFELGTVLTPFKEALAFEISTRLVKSDCRF